MERSQGKTSLLGSKGKRSVHKAMNRLSKNCNRIRENREKQTFSKTNFEFKDNRCSGNP